MHDYVVVFIYISNMMNEMDHKDNLKHHVSITRGAIMIGFQANLEVDINLSPLREKLKNHVKVNAMRPRKIKGVPPMALQTARRWTWEGYHI